jgi:hypothetical protein
MKEVINKFKDLKPYISKFFGVSSDFVGFIAENKQWNLLPHNTSLS